MAERIVLLTQFLDIHAVRVRVRTIIALSPVPRSPVTVRDLSQFLSVLQFFPSLSRVAVEKHQVAFPRKAINYERT